MRKLCWACGGFSAGVFLGVYVLSGTALWAAAVCLAISPLPALGRRGMPWRVARLTLSFLAAGLVCCGAHTLLYRAPAEALTGETRTVSARVLDLPAVYESSTVVEVRLTGADAPHVKCRVTAYGENWLDTLQPGDEIAATLRFSSASTLYGEETDFYSARGVFLRGVCVEEVTVTGRCVAAWRYAPRLLRQRMAALCRSLFPADVASFQTALLTGERTELYQDYPRYYALSRAGLMHVVAVSGMHVSYLSGLVWFLEPNRRRSALLLLPLLLLFAALMGFTPSVSRSVFMQLCFVSAPLARREGDSPTAMALALALLLLRNPWAAGSVSLQLSFAATAGILLFTQRIRDYLAGRIAPRRRVSGLTLYKIYSVVGVTAGALIFTVPLTALHYGYVSLVSPLSNLLCLWMTPVLFVGGYLTLLAGALFPAAGRAAAWLLAWGDRAFFAVGSFLSRLPMAAVYTVNRVFVVWLALVYALFFLWLIRRKKGEPPRILWPLCLSALSLCAAVLLTRASWGRGLRATVLDVGQGECVLCEYGSEAVMVDCGATGTLRNAGETAGYYVLSRCRGDLSALILTHLHADHVNGVARLLSLVRVERLYLPAESADTEGALPEILEAAERAGTEVVWVTEDTVLAGERLRVSLTAPRRLSPDENDNGLLVCVSAGENEVLITGDAGASLERRYAALSEGLDAEVLVVGHHGSASSSDALFLRSIRAELAVISVGYNSYGQPRPEALERLAQSGAAIRRTDEDGNVTILLKEK